jgi:hypothetical protein
MILERQRKVGGKTDLTFQPAKPVGLTKLEHPRKQNVEGKNLEKKRKESYF